MAKAKHTSEELKEKQALPLDLKIRMTERRIREWVDYFGLDGVYVSFSGGKDSTVLLHIARRLYPDIPAVFFDTGMEYPEIREFVKTFDNVTFVRPNCTFKEVLNKFGYPIISKEVSEMIVEARRYLASGGTKYVYRMAKLLGIDKKRQPDEYENIKQGILPPDAFTRPDTANSPYDGSRYRYLLNAPFLISGYCCQAMKKLPAKSYERATGRHKIMAVMASESMLRRTNWLTTGCNSFNGSSPKSNPMSFWKQQDVLEYIRSNCKMCKIYGDIVDGKEGLQVTGATRTGCMYCGFGAHREKKGERRFEKMKTAHPKHYRYIMETLGMKNVFDWINKNSGGRTYIHYGQDEE